MRTRSKTREMVIDGFTSEIRASQNIVLASHGLHRRGKTRFALTAPKPIGVLPLDRNTRGTVELFLREFPEHRGKILLPDEDLVSVGSLAALEERSGRKKTNKPEDEKKILERAIETYARHIRKVRELYFRLVGIKGIKTILVDTGTQLWDDTLFSHFGRSFRIMPYDKGQANHDMVDFINACGNKHLIITHRAKEVWAPDSKGKRAPTGKFDSTGFPHVDSYVNVIVEHLRRKDRKTKEIEFGVRVRDAQLNPDLAGDKDSELWGDECEFAFLAMQLYPDSELEDWE